MGATQLAASSEADVAIWVTLVARYGLNCANFALAAFGRPDWIFRPSIRSRLKPEGPSPGGGQRRYNIPSTVRRFRLPILMLSGFMCADVRRRLGAHFLWNNYDVPPVIHRSNMRVQFAAYQSPAPSIRGCVKRTICPSNVQPNALARPIGPAYTCGISLTVSPRIASHSLRPATFPGNPHPRCLIHSL
jgi:hypothetical protein